MILQPRRRGLLQAGFQRGRQDFRDRIAGSAMGWWNERFFISLPGAREARRNRIVPPQVDLRREESKHFREGREQGREDERRTYERRHPQVGDLSNESLQSPSNPVFSQIVGS